MTPKLQSQLEKLGIIFVIWIMMGIILGTMDHLILHSSFSTGVDPNYTFINNMIINVIAATVGAFLGGSFLIFFVNERFRDKPYGFSIAAVCIAFIAITTVITFILAAIQAPLFTGKPLSDPETKEMMQSIFLDPANLKNILAWAIIVGVTQLLLSVNDKFGPGLLWDFIRGKYHSPREETRIFMFVDLKSSTTIAEKLGNEQYYRLLRDYFADVTDAIIYNRGQIYQYAGDEVIISWKIENGKDNCLKCFFDMQKTIRDKADKYTKKFGLVPEFKAGLHYGKVTVGEIGIIKRDITFSGDVLNTAARIQTQCNEYDVLILSSNELLEVLNLNGFRQQAIGKISLKGKQQEVELSTVELV